MPGLKHSFRIGFSHSWYALKSASMNIVYATRQPSVIDNYLQTEIARDRIAGPFPTSPYLHISRFGVIPKNNQLGKWQLILDLSSQLGHSVNDGMPQLLFSVQYVSIDEFIDSIMVRGQGTLMAKFVVTTTYHNNCSPSRWSLSVGYEVEGCRLCWQQSSFWLAFNAVYFHLCCGYGGMDLDPQSWCWVLVSLFGWLLILGPPASDVCLTNLALFLQLCFNLPLPLHPDKLEGLTMSLTIFGDWTRLCEGLG